METKDSFHIFGGSFLTHTLTEILTKYNIKKNVNKVNIWGPFYMYKCECLGGG